MRICIVIPQEIGVSETFIAAHSQRLQGVVGVVNCNAGRPELNKDPLLATNYSARVWRKAKRWLRAESWEAQERIAYETAFRKLEADVVLAEYGPTGVAVMEACCRVGVPLVVHFHGYDASKRDVLRRMHDRYKRMFEQAAAVVAVSRAMVKRLVELGCPRHKICYSPYGVDCDQFVGANPAATAARFVAVGRFVEKKAPYLTLFAFAKTVAECEDARLVMIGDGPLLGVCKDVANALGVGNAVEFLGAQPHDAVMRAMQEARAFVQHSIVGSDGDCEGTPVAIIEASAMGLAVVATRHAGIPDVVAEGRTGLLVEEKDVPSMAGHMISLARSRHLAAELGANGAKHVRRAWQIEMSIARLTTILRAAARHEAIEAVQDEIGREFDDAMSRAVAG